MSQDDPPSARAAKSWSPWEALSNCVIEQDDVQEQPGSDTRTGTIIVGGAKR
jgi:hypothetical protein